MKNIRYLLEYLILFTIFILFSLLPLNLVSIIGGKIFQFFGPFSNAHKTSISNLKKVFPNISEEKINKIALKSWENLGKTLVEIIILNKLLNTKNDKIEIQGINYLEEIKKRNEQVIFFGIHQANWELLVPLIDRLGIKLGAIYRHINNPFINNLILKSRNKTIVNSGTFYTPKGKESAKEVLLAINQGKSIILLIDQKDNAGEIINFFNHDVKTQTGFLKIARKNNLKLIPVQNIRKKVNNFNIIFHKPIDLKNKNNNEIDTMNDIHKIIEKWIESNPDQWLWQHKRFN